MSEITNVTSDIAGEKFYAAQAQKAKEQASQKQLVPQDASNTTGVQWAQAQSPVKAQPKANFEIVQPNIEDVAVLSTTVSMNDEAVDAPKPGYVATALADKINMNALLESYREYFKKSKSHNLLLERFMSNVKFSALKGLLSMMGMSAEEQVKIQAKAKDEALAEIDSKIKNDWAYTKVMMEITTGM